jgi:hypothetical protein
MFEDRVEPWDYEDSARFMAQQDYEHDRMDQRAEEALERSVAQAEESDEILENF